MEVLNQTTRLALIRHAETEWNRSKRIQGQDDSPLTPEGRRLAEAWGRVLAAESWDAVLSSDLGRAAETAALVNCALKAPLRRDPRLREQHWGRWTGRTLRDVETSEPDRLTAAESAGWAFTPPDGESRLDVWDRSSRALSEAGRCWPGGNILVVTHEGVIKCLVYRLTGRRFLPGEPRLIRPHQVHRLTVDPNGLRLEQANAQPLPDGRNRSI